MARELLTIDEIMAILPETPRRIRAVADALTPAQLAAAPEADAWSIGEILAHLRASQDVLGRSILRILAEEKPAWRRLSPRTYMRKTDYPNWEFSLALEAFTTQRAELLDVVASLAPRRVGSDCDRDREARRDTRAKRALLRRLVGGA